MTIITKKRLTISLGVLLFAAIVIWYFFPVFVNKWFMYQTAGFTKYVAVSPTYIEKLPESPKNWDKITIDALSFKLPISEYKKIRGVDNFIYFTSDAGTFLVSDIAPSEELTKIMKEKNLRYPFISYEDRLATVKSLPSDISFFNSRRKNVQGAFNQYFKFLSVSLGGIAEIDIVNPELLKAIIIKSEYRDKYNYSATATVYSQNDKMSFDIMLKNYKDKQILDAHLLQILGSLQVPDHQLSIQTVKQDIQTIVNKYKRTEQFAQPDSQ